jgi:hypothetical protein
MKPQPSLNSIPNSGPPTLQQGVGQQLSHLLGNPFMNPGFRMMHEAKNNAPMFNPFALSVNLSCELVANEA